MLRRRKGDEQKNMENEAETYLGAVMATESTHKRQRQSREALRTRRECPHCMVSMTYHTILYKHVCRGPPELKRKWLLERLDKRIRERVVPPSEVELDSPQPMPG